MSHTYSENFIKNSDYFTGESTKVRIGDLVTWNDMDYFIVLDTELPKDVKVISGIYKKSNRFVARDPYPRLIESHYFGSCSIALKQKLCYRFDKGEVLSHKVDCIEYENLWDKTSSYLTAEGFLDAVLERANSLYAEHNQSWTKEATLKDNYSSWVKCYDRYAPPKSQDQEATTSTVNQSSDNQKEKENNNMAANTTLTDKVSNYTSSYVESGWEGAKDGASYAAANYITNSAVTFLSQFVPGIQVFNKTDLGHTVLVVLIPFLVGIISIWTPNTFAMVGLTTEQIQEISRRSCRAAVSHRVSPLLDGFGDAMADSLRKAALSLNVANNTEAKS